MHSALVLFPFFSVIILNLPFKGWMKKIAFGLGMFLALLQIGLVLFPATFFGNNIPDVFGNLLKFQLSARLLFVTLPSDSDAA